VSTQQALKTIRITVLALGLGTTALAVPASARADAAAAPAGAQLYKDKCQRCHGADAGGGTDLGKALKVKDLRKHETQAKTDAELAATITAGKGWMLPQTGLSAAQVSQLVAYIRTLAKAK
jgi:cytochrome c6